MLIQNFWAERFEYSFESSLTYLEEYPSKPRNDSDDPNWVVYQSWLENMRYEK